MTETQRQQIADAQRLRDSRTSRKARAWMIENARRELAAAIAASTIEGVTACQP